MKTGYAFWISGYGRRVPWKKLRFCGLITALCLLVFSFSACRSESTAVNAEASAESSIADTENADRNWDILSSVDVLCEEGDNYQIYTNAEETAYRYVVLDDNGETLDQGITIGAAAAYSMKRMAFCS